MSTSSDIKRVKAKMHRNADQVIREVGLRALKEVVKRTPVGDPSNWKNPPPLGYVGGRARNNWNTAEGRMDESTTEDTADTAVARGRSVLANLKFGDTLFITNGLPYINRLEHGWSEQAPAGMVGVTVALLRPWVERITARLR